MSGIGTEKHKGVESLSENREWTAQMRRGQAGRSCKRFAAVLTCAGLVSEQTRKVSQAGNAASER